MTWKSYAVSVEARWRDGAEPEDVHPTTAPHQVMPWVQLKAPQYIGREVREISATQTQQPAQTMGKKNNLSMLQSKASYLQTFVSVHDCKQKDSGVLELCNNPQPEQIKIIT